MQVYNEMAILATDEAQGQLVVAWFDNTRDGQGKLVTPIDEQNVLTRAHKIPPEAESNNWTRDQLRDWWLGGVEDVADIPAWAEAEIGKVVMVSKERLKATVPGNELPF